MTLLLRTFWLVSCPVLSASATLHVPLERAVGAEIEHNLNLEGKHCRLLSETLEPGTLAECAAPQSNAQIVSGHGILADCPEIWVGCSDVGRDASARHTAFLLTVRLLV